MLFFETAGGDNRRTDTQTRGYKRRLWVTRYSVLVYSDVGTTQSSISSFTGQALLDQAQQEQVVLSAAGNDFKTALDQHFSHRISVLNNLRLVLFELRFQCFFKRYRFSSDNVHQRTTLTAWEYR